MKTIVTIRMNVDGNRGYKAVFVQDVIDIDACDKDGQDVELDARNLERASNKLIEKFFLEG